MNKKMCPSCEREITVFEPRDIEGGFFYKHNDAKGVVCWWSLRAYPRPTQRAADSPSGYSVKPSMKKWYKFAIVNCPNCQRPVKENWLVKHIKSGCKIPVTKKTASR